MAKNKQTQIPLVSADGSATQPPFPGGWVLAIIAALEQFTGLEIELLISSRTKVRINNGDAITQTGREKLIDALTALVKRHFPAVASINDFARKYCVEYYDCWTVAVEIAPEWTRAFGYEPVSNGVLARALIRDLVLRLAYLESCNRALAQDTSLARQQPVFRADGPRALYASMLQSIQSIHGDSLEATAINLGTNDAQLRRIRRGEAVPTWVLLEEMAGPEMDVRLVAGVGWLDTLFHKLGQHEGSLGSEIFALAEIFFPAHAFALAEVGRKRGCLENVMKEVGNLLLHPGFDCVWRKLPSALWRAHLYNLQFARMPDLAHAYVQFGEEENERELNRFFDEAESKRGGSPFAWMDALRERNPALPFPNSPAS